MGLLVRALQIYMPEYVKKRALMQLFSYTAAAFEAQVPPIAGLDSEECLAQYARFAQTHAEQRLRDGREVEAVAAAPVPERGRNGPDCTGSCCGLAPCRT